MLGEEDGEEVGVSRGWEKEEGLFKAIEANYAAGGKLAAILFYSLDWIILSQIC